MRSAAAVPACFALLQAFFLGPFQHVHTGGTHGAFIHAHFYSLFEGAPAPADRPSGIRFTADDDGEHHDTAAAALDTFTLVLTAGLSPFVPTRGPVVEVVLSATTPPLQPVEQRAHAPPYFEPSAPRAPPV